LVCFLLFVFSCAANSGKIKMCVTVWGQVMRLNSGVDVRGRALVLRLNWAVVDPSILFRHRRQCPGIYIAAGRLVQLFVSPDYTTQR